MNCSDIRQQFVGFFDQQGFQLLPPAPMLHPSIPMSFVMSAGLVQVETVMSELSLEQGERFTLVQNCFRHFDLETVGTTPVHLSLFEMAAAFMFGTSARELALSNMWRFTTEVLGIDEQRLWVSYFKGGEVAGQLLPEDRQTYEAWLDLGVAADRLVGLGIDDNFWIQSGSLKGQDAQLRKCGANTELFYDRGSQHSCGVECSVSCRCGRFVEFSNTLFIAFQINAEFEEIEAMAVPFVETVVGIERLAMVLQGVDSVFEIKRYRLLMDAMLPFVSSNLVTSLQYSHLTVIVDHLRALCVLIRDGAPFAGQGGRKRLIRKLIRGIATRQFILGIDADDFLPTMINVISDVFLLAISKKVKQKIQQCFNEDFKRFSKTVDRGRRQLDRYLEVEGKLTGKEMVFLEKKLGLPYLLIDWNLNNKNIEIPYQEYLLEITNKIGIENV